MAEAVATYAFLGWLRRGISAAVDDGATEGGRLAVPVDVSFGQARNAGLTLRLSGPGDVVGLDPRVVIRTWPPRNVYDAEPGSLPMVELEDATLPWRYTAAGADPNDRLQPWLRLLVLTDDEVESVLPATGTRPLPVVTIADAPLPVPDQAWAWAHVQVTGETTVDPAAAAELLEREPRRVLSRLLCPRRLDPLTRYTAFLVPTFEAGRRAGMGLPLADAPPPETLAWTPGTRSIQLPVYYSWRFGTSVAHDLEELVGRLVPRELPAGIGLRDMDVADPGAGLPSAAPRPLGMEGALRARETVSTPWPAAARQPFVAALRSLLNRPAELLAQANGLRAVAPPLYGRWYAAEDRLRAAAGPAWFREANSDPRLRAAAGLGAQVVQANQRQLMAGAWQQAPGLDRINEVLRVTQVARELAARIHVRHLSAQDDELVLQVTAPVHGRILGSAVTIAARLAASPIVDGLASSGWRRVARPLGPVGRRQRRPRGERPRVLARTNRLRRVGDRLEPELSSAPPLRTSPRMATPARVAADLVPAWADHAPGAGLRRVAPLLGPAGAAGLAAAAVARLAGGRRPIVTAGTLAGGLVATVSGPVRRIVERAERARALRDGTLTPKLVETTPARPSFTATESRLVSGAEPGRPPVRPGREDSASARAFRAASGAVLADADAAIAPAIPAQPVPLRQLRNTLVRELDPRTTIGARVRDRLQLGDLVAWNPLDPLEPVLVGPDFPQPMYRPLAELSQDWLLPGLEEVPANTVSLVETNQRFVEAYMLGLNHELGNELLWREYPTDQRRTFFRQFWDPTGLLGPAGAPVDRERVADILPIHRWDAAADLGENSGRDASATQRLVLLIRGDVIRHHPDLIVYALRGRWTAAGVRELGSDEQHPVFSGLLEPEVAFFGFALTDTEVRGSDDPADGDPGWFFVLQERPSEPRFGLDTGPPGADGPVRWNDLHWGHLVPAGGELADVQHVDLDADLPDTRFVADPAGVAWHAESGIGPAGARSSDLAYILLQRPFRLAVHASGMLTGA